MKLGITVSEKAIAQVATLATTIDQVLKGGITPADMFAMPGLVKDASAVVALKTELVALKAEAMDWDAQEKSVLAKIFQEKLELTADTIEVAVETGFNLALELVDAVQTVVSLVKKLTGKA